MHDAQGNESCPSRARNTKEFMQVFQYRHDSTFRSGLYCASYTKKCAYYFKELISLQTSMSDMPMQKFISYLLGYYSFFFSCYNYLQYRYWFCSLKGESSIFQVGKILGSHLLTLWPEVGLYKYTKDESDERGNHWWNLHTLVLQSDLTNKGQRVFQYQFTDTSDSVLHFFCHCMKQSLYEEVTDLVTGRRGATVNSTHSVLIKDDIHLACWVM